MSILELDGKQTRLLSTYCVDFTPKTPMNPYCNGLQWTDFVVDPKALSRNTLRALACNKELTLAVLKAGSSPTKILAAIIRAHQHRTNDKEPIMELFASTNNGCVQLWKDGDQEKLEIKPRSVITLLLSPDSLMGMTTKTFRGFDYDTSLIIKPARLFPWEATVINNTIYSKRPNP